MEKFTGRVEILSHEDVKGDVYFRMYMVPTAPNAKPGDYKVYRRKWRKDWRLMSYKHQVLDPGYLAWMVEDFSGRDGVSYIQDVWTLSEKDRLSNTTVRDGEATTTFYKNNIPYMWNNKEQGPVDAEVTYVHSVDAGKLGKMLKFRLLAFDPRPTAYGNNWKDPGGDYGGWDITSGGWPYNRGGELGRPAEPGVEYKPPREDPRSYKIGWPLKIYPRDEILNDSVLDFLKIEHSTSNGNLSKRFGTIRTRRRLRRLSSSFTAERTGRF